MPLRPLAQLGAFVALALGVAQYQQRLRTASAPTTTTYHCYAGVRTHVDEQPAARCFGVRDGVFASVFGADEMAALGQEAEHVVHRDGESYAIPGLWDGHGHVLQYGEFLHSVDLFGASSFEEVRRRIEEYVERNPGAGAAGQWIRGVGWDQVQLGRMPTADDLESDALRGLYMMLDRTDIHCNWVSHPVLALLTSDELKTDMPGGDIIRDPGYGVFCDNAMDLLVVAKWPAPDRTKVAEFARTAMRDLNAVGIVGVHDAMTMPNDLGLFEGLADAGDLSVRLYLMLKCEALNSFCIGDARKIERDDGMLAARSVKIFGDGALGSWGAAMLEPYSDRDDGMVGTLMANATELVNITEKWARAGYQVNIHAIGDLTNRIAVDAIENALRVLSPDDQSPEALAALQKELRFRIEHAQIIDPVDQERIRALGIIPSIQPTHATSDMTYAHSRLGTQRMEASAYRMRSLLDLDICLGSDFPVEPPNPFRGMYAAMTRRSPLTGRGVVDSQGDWTVDGWHTDEAIGLDDAMRGFTTNPAKAAFMDGRAGIIAPGAWADWVVLGEELAEGMDAERLRSVMVKETWVGGKRVFPVDEPAGRWGWLDGVRDYLRI